MGWEVRSDMKAYIICAIPKYTYYMGVSITDKPFQSMYLQIIYPQALVGLKQRLLWRNLVPATLVNIYPVKLDLSYYFLPPIHLWDSKSGLKWWQGEKFRVWHTFLQWNHQFLWWHKSFLWYNWYPVDARVQNMWAHTQEFYEHNCTFTVSGNISLYFSFLLQPLTVSLHYDPILSLKI